VHGYTHREIHLVLFRDRFKYVIVVFKCNLCNPQRDRILSSRVNIHQKA